MNVDQTFVKGNKNNGNIEIRLSKTAIIVIGIVLVVVCALCFCRPCQPRRLEMRYFGHELEEGRQNEGRKSSGSSGVSEPLLLDDLPTGTVSLPLTKAKSTCRAVDTSGVLTDASLLLERNMADTQLEKGIPPSLDNEPKNQTVRQGKATKLIEPFDILLTSFPPSKG